MKNSHHKAFNSIYVQSGSTLLVTLFVLLLIALVSVMAIRRGHSDLAMSTAAQVDKLVFQANDFALNKFEKESDSTDFARMDNVMGYLILSKEDPVGREVTFCLKQNKNSFFDISAITERNVTNGYIKSRNNGFCDVTSDGYTSNRKVMMTQMTVTEKKLTAKQKKAYLEANKTYVQHMQQTGKQESSFLPRRIQVTTNALIPAYSVNTSLSDIKECVKNRSGLVSSPLVVSAPMTVKKCIDDKGIINNQQTQEYYYRPKGIKVNS